MSFINKSRKEKREILYISDESNNKLAKGRIRKKNDKVPDKLSSRKLCKNKSRLNELPIEQEILRSILDYENNIL